MTGYSTGRFNFPCLDRCSDHGLRQALDADLNLVSRGVREVQAELAGGRVLRVEGLARHEGNVISDALVKQGLGVHPIRNLDPEEHPPGGPGEFDVGREVLFHRRDHGVLAAAVKVGDLPDVFIDVVLLKELGDRVLGEIIGVQVDGLLEHREVGDQFLVCDQPANPHPRCQDLGEG